MSESESEMRMNRETYDGYSKLTRSQCQWNSEDGKRRCEMCLKTGRLCNLKTCERKAEQRSEHYFGFVEERVCVASCECESECVRVS